MMQEADGAGLSSVQLVQHSSVPYALGWGAAVGAAGNDNRVRVACTHTHTHRLMHGPDVVLVRCVSCLVLLPCVHTCLYICTHAASLPRPCWWQLSSDPGL